MSKARDIADSASTINSLDGVTASGIELNALDNMSRGSILYGNASGQTTALAAGAANTVLKSDGADLSWGEAAGGGAESEFTATGTIASGKTVALRSDGTVEVVGETPVANTFKSDVSIAGNNYLDRCHIAYDKINDIVLIAECDYSNVHFNVGRVDASTGVISFASSTSTMSQAGSYDALCYDETGGDFIYVYQSSHYTYFASITITGTTGAVSSWGISVSSGQWGSEYQSASFGLAYQPNNGNCIWYAAYGSASSSNYPIAYHVTSSGGSISISGRLYPTGYNGYTNVCPTFSLDQNNTLWATFAAFDINTSTYPIWTMDFGGSGTSTPTINQRYWFYPQNQSMNDSSFSAFGADDELGTTCNILVVGGREHSTGSYNTHCVCYESTGNAASPALTVRVADYQFPNAHISPTYNADSDHLVYSKEGNRWMFYRKITSSNNLQIWAIDYSVANTTLALDTTGSVLITEGSSNRIVTGDIPYTNGHWIPILYPSSTDSKWNVKCFRFGYTTTNNVDFIGVAQSAISGGATGKISLGGSVVEGLTGLTVNGTAYLQSDGTISNTSTGSISPVAIGKNLSATTVLLKGV